MNNTRKTDMPDEQRFWDLEHSVKDLKKDFDVLNDKVSEGHGNLKTAIKDLAESHRDLANAFVQQSLSLTKMEASLNAVARSFTWFFPVLLTIVALVVGGIWTYNDSVNKRIDQSAIISNTEKK